MEQIKHHYTVTYVTYKGYIESFEVEAANWEELKTAIDEQLPYNAKYLVGVSYNKWASDAWEE